MWIVLLALRRPYTFIVGALLVVIFGVLSLLRMPTDIFPEIDIPVVSVIWAFNGIPPEEMERRFTTPYERAVTTTVNDVEHIESQSMNGVSVIKVFFQRGAEIESAVAQLAAVSQSILRIDGVADIGGRQAARVQLLGVEIHIDQPRPPAVR